MVAVHAVGAGPAAAADLVVLAHAAFALVAGLVAELPEVGIFAPYPGKRRFTHIAAGQFQIATWLHLAHMTDKAESRAPQAAARERIHAEEFRCDRKPFFTGTLAHNAVIMGGAGSLEVHVSAFAKIVQPVQHLFIFCGSDHLVGQPCGTTHGHQQKDMPGRSAQLLTEIEDLWKTGKIVTCNRGIDLEGHASLFQKANAPQRCVKGTGHAPKAVMACCVWPVNGNGTAVDSGFAYFMRRLGSDQGAVGCKGTDKPLGMRISHEVVHVGPHHGVAARKDDDGPAHLWKGVNEALGLLCGQFAGEGGGMGLGPAVFAGQIAGTRHLPSDEPAHRAAVFQGARGRSDAGGMPYAVPVHQRTSPSRRRVSVK